MELLQAGESSDNLVMTDEELVEWYRSGQGAKYFTDIGNAALKAADAIYSLRLFLG